MSEHTTIEEQQKVREKESLAQKRKVVLIECPCEINSESICESVSYKLRDTLQWDPTKGEIVVFSLSL